MATGLEVYESTMRPVRAAVQGIFAQQENLRSEREAERKKLEAEGRAEQRQIATEGRLEDRQIRQEDRLRKRRDEESLSKAKAEASRLGLSIEGNLYEIEGRIADYKEKEPSRAFLMSNIDIIRGQKLIDGETISLIENNKLSKEKNIIVAGGLTNYDDLKNLKKLNINNLEGVIAGKSFYVGNIDLVRGQQILNYNG